MTRITMYKITAVILQLSLNLKTLCCKLHNPEEGCRNTFLIISSWSMAPAVPLEYEGGPFLAGPYLSWQVAPFHPHIVGHTSYM